MSDRIGKYTHIHRVGVELEGGWAGERPSKFKHDGSVTNIDKAPKCNAEQHPCHCRDCFPRGYNCLVSHVGEVISEPMLPLQIEGWLKDNYPVTSNESCGYHIHLSFTKQIDSYLILMKPEFFDKFTKDMNRLGVELGLKASHPFWKRLRGDNQYCRKTFNPEAQAKLVTVPSGPHQDGTRYTQLNYCWSKHKTLENRLFPMFETPEVAWQATIAYMNCVQEFLENNTLEYSAYKEEVTRQEEVNYFVPWRR